MSNPEVSIVTDEDGHIIGKDYVYENDDGSTTVSHHKADSGATGGLFGARSLGCTGETTYYPDGTSKHTDKS